MPSVALCASCGNGNCTRGRVTAVRAKEEQVLSVREGKIGVYGGGEGPLVGWRWTQSRRQYIRGQPSGD